MIVLSRYELARLVGLRALQLSEGAEPRVVVSDPALRLDAVFVAALELHTRVMDACVERGGARYHVSTVTFPPDLATMLNSRDGGTRSA
jgi:DNA-directed RNA polymerase subunit K/omega